MTNKTKRIVRKLLKTVAVMSSALLFINIAFMCAKYTDHTQTMTAVVVWFVATIANTFLYCLVDGCNGEHT